jgi:NitT/TauT family transport system ATP-binding protein
VATSYPKSSPTELLGLLVLLDSHKGSEDVALLADDLDLEIDEILPSLEYAELLQLVKVADGRASFTDLGRKLVAASIRERKSMLREQLKRTTLFKTLLRALEGAPEHRLSDEQLAQLLAFTPAIADDAVQHIVNWGRYAELFRYDAKTHELALVRRSSTAKSSASHPPPPAGPEPGRSDTSSRKSPPRPAEPPIGPAGVVPATA